MAPVAFTVLSGVSSICFYGIIWEIFLAELYGWLTGYIPGIMKWQIFGSAQRKRGYLFIRKKLHVPRLFYKIALRVFVAGKSSHLAPHGGQEHESIEFLCKMG
ncbi:MAG: hypothetical protein CMP85_02165 [Gammaproteobacteria bacterium]|nr:hypothetical protein [Gammaproteobacteria bacterium]|tara:strand:+ start:173 stop:481 length:309 start_codon:yes stop_codon:yes gene_type:complete